MPITLVDRNGPPEALTCPAVICDDCGEPINARGPVGGLAVWIPATGHDDRPTVNALAFVHKGACDRAWSAGKRHAYSRDLDEFMAQLSHNFANPFTAEPGVEYVAPTPSTWRLGDRRR
jgi:hypothetical protein